MFITKFEEELGSEYITQGYIIRPVADKEALNWIRTQFVNLVTEALEITDNPTPEELLNQLHQRVSVADLNAFRLKIIRGFNAIEGFREKYYQVAKPYLEALVGNELAMQLRVNLSIQFPDDTSSLLPVHADTWAGDSPYEVVVWLPLVNCYGTKAMYLLPPNKAEDLNKNFAESAGKNSEELYLSISDDVKWLDVNYGEVLVFDQALPHGNRVNTESETRWSMNCRFKGVFTPYGDKKLGEFFEPITLKAATKTGMSYKLPAI